MITNILLVEDHKIVREGLVSLLEKDLSLKVVGEADDGRDAVRLAAELKPDVVIMDLSLPGLNGIDAARLILQDNPGVKVVALSVHADRRFVKAMLQAGASGYLLKYSASQELLKAIQLVMAGRVYLSPEIAGVVVEDYTSPTDETSAFALLTVREREVLQLLAEGRAPREICDTLNLGLKTVEGYRRQVMEKLGFKSMADLVKYAIREGLVSLET
jgi:two-component system, NarL family, response regulator NreC